jgi:hypothetical protein
MLSKLLTLQIQPNLGRLFDSKCAFFMHKSNTAIDFEPKITPGRILGRNVTAHVNILGDLASFEKNEQNLAKTWFFHHNF